MKKGIHSKRDVHSRPPSHLTMRAAFLQVKHAAIIKVHQPYGDYGNNCLAEFVNQWNLSMTTICTIQNGFLLICGWIVQMYSPLSILVKNICLEKKNSLTCSAWNITKQPFLSHEIGFLMNGTPRNEYIKLGFIRICTDIPSISEFPARSSLALSILLRLTRRKSICSRWPMTLPYFANRKQNAIWKYQFKARSKEPN